MTTLSKEDVVRWAREAGCNIITTPDDVVVRYNDVRVTNMLGRFAEAARADLVADNERRKDAQFKRLEREAEKRMELRTALAAAEARENKTLSALNQFIEEFDGCYAEGEPAMIKARAASAQPRDGSALREMIAGVYEECAKGCRKEAVVIVVDGPEERAYNNAISDCELAIRALAEKARHGN